MQCRLHFHCTVSLRAILLKRNKDVVFDACIWELRTAFKGPSIKYVTLFWTNLGSSSSLCHTLSHISGPLMYVIHLGTPAIFSTTKKTTKLPVQNLSQLNLAKPISKYVFLYLCVYLWMELCMYTCMLYMYVCTHTCMYPIFPHIYTHTGIHIYIHAYAHAYIHECVHAYVHTYMHIYTQTYIH